MAFKMTRPTRKTVAPASSAVADTAHEGDIVGALGTIKQHDHGARRSFWQRLRTFLVIMGPGLVVMVGDNDAGGVQTYAQAGQQYGTGLMWTLLLLVPVLYVNQEMVVRLGAVARVGHAKLIFQRFGKFWGAFSVADLFLLNTLTIITEFIGVTYALRYFGIPDYFSVPAAAVLLFTVVAGGSFRRWERFLFVLIAANLVLVPLAIMVGPDLGRIGGGFLPQLPGGLNSDLLLLVVSIVGTTVAPWQLFFQQSNVVDKRITPRWMRYSKADLWAGIVIVVLGAVAIMAVTAFGLAGTGAAGNWGDNSNAGTVASALASSPHAGHVVGALFAVLLLDASLIGANAVGLATTYTLGDVFKKRHSLHWKISQAPGFFIGYGVVLAVSAGVVLIPGFNAGLITQGVQILAGVLLPSATVFLVLLCNDKAVLGPWVNTVRQNIAAGIIVWALVLLSLAMTASTLFPKGSAWFPDGISSAEWVAFFTVGAGVGALGGLAVLLASRVKARKEAAATARRLGGLDPEQVEDIDEDAQDALSRTERQALLRADRDTWQTPALDTLPRPVFSPLRKAGMLALRGYLAIAVVLVVITIVQMATGG